MAPTIQGCDVDAIAVSARRGKSCDPQCKLCIISCCAAWPYRPQKLSDTSGVETPPIVIKKYANRRLYNTATSSYVTLDNLSMMVREGGDFIVYDAKNGEDITRSVLTQIIVEEEQKGQNLLPIGFLRQLIGFYGNNMQWLVPRYLEQAMSSFGRNQEQMRKSLQDAFGGLFPFGPFEEMGKQNMALFEKTMKMFSPFGQFPRPPTGRAPPKSPRKRSRPDGSVGAATRCSNASRRSAAADRGLRQGRKGELSPSRERPSRSEAGSRRAWFPAGPATAYRVSACRSNTLAGI